MMKVHEKLRSIIWLRHEFWHFECWEFFNILVMVKLRSVTTVPHFRIYWGTCPTQNLLPISCYHPRIFVPPPVPKFSRNKMRGWRDGSRWLEKYKNANGSRFWLLIILRTKYTRKIRENFLNYEKQLWNVS